MHTDGGHGDDPHDLEQTRQRRKRMRTSEVWPTFRSVGKTSADATAYFKSRRMHAQFVVGRTQSAAVHAQDLGVPVLE